MTPPGPKPLLLPRGVTEAQLRAAVAASRSWRGVLRHLGKNATTYNAKLRSACNELDIDYSHFVSVLATDAKLRDVITTSATWPEALARLGYARPSGNARATVRRHCLRLVFSTQHLVLNTEPAGPQIGGGTCVRTWVVCARLGLTWSQLPSVLRACQRAWPPKERDTTSWPTWARLASCEFR